MRTEKNIHIAIPSLAVIFLVCSCTGSNPSTSNTTPTNSHLGNYIRVETPVQNPVPTTLGRVGEWSQDAHDAQRTGYTDEDPKTSSAGNWTYAWSWNGADDEGKGSEHRYQSNYHMARPQVPWEARTVTGGNNVYVPAADAGIYALAKATGEPVWNIYETAFNATPAYDPATDCVFAGGDNGVVYKIKSNSGEILGKFQGSGAIRKALLIAGSSVYAVSNDGFLYRIDMTSMNASWSYNAASPIQTMPAWSASRDVIVFGTKDLYVHAVDTATGKAKWKIKPTSPEQNNEAGFPYSDNGQNAFLNTTANHPEIDSSSNGGFEYSGGWPVIAEAHGIVFIRLNIPNVGGNNFSTGPSGGYPTSPTEIREYLIQNPRLKNLFPLSLDTGAEVFVSPVGNQSTEDQLPSGTSLGRLQTAPVIKTAESKELCYTAFRSRITGYDSRWDSHFGEMVLDDSSLSGMQTGDIRFIQFGKQNVAYAFISDEVNPYTMAGNTIFHAHWGASESVTVTNRGPSFGSSYDNPIKTSINKPLIRAIPANSYESMDAITRSIQGGSNVYNDSRYYNGPLFWGFWGNDGGFHAGYGSIGILPRYTYVSDGLIIIEGNGGELTVLKYQ